MEENKNLQNTSLEEGEVAALGSEDTETPPDKNVRLMSPTRMRAQSQYSAIATVSYGQNTTAPRRCCRRVSNKYLLDESL